MAKLEARGYTSKTRAMLHVFTLALLLFAHSGFAGDVVAPTMGQPESLATAEKAHPDLLRLEKALARKQDEKKAGRITPEQHQQWTREFREQLDAVMARVPPSPDNTAAHVRIMALLGDSEQAQAVVGNALGQNPESPVLLRTQGQIRYEQKDFPGAADSALQAWEKSGHSDQAAWALYQMSKGRTAPSKTGSISSGVIHQTRGPTVVTTEDSSKPVKLTVKSGTPVGVVPIPNQEESGKPRGKGGMPLWPLSIPFAGGLIAYGVYRGGKHPAEQESEQPPTEALVATPLLSGEAASLAGGVAKGAAVKTLGDIAITGTAAVGILIAGGGALVLTVNRGLDEMIAAQDKYNAAIDTHKPLQGTYNVSTKGMPESRRNEDDCSLRRGEDILGKFLDGTRLAPGYLRQHEGPKKGHTLRDHVGQKLSDLARQIKAGKSDASSYPNMAIAEEIARRSIDNNRALIEAWFVRRTQANQPTRYTGSHLRAIGYTISEQNPSTPLPKYDAATILQKTGNCRILILTSYPQ